MSGNHWLKVDVVILTVTAFLQAVSLIACLARSFHSKTQSFLAARLSRGGVCGWGVGAGAVERANSGCGDLKPCSVILAPWQDLEPRGNKHERGNHPGSQSKISALWQQSWRTP